MSKKQYATFSDRFIESFAGSTLMSEPRVAIIELIANAWDAGATEVKVSWPEEDGEQFSISDNGHGMSETEFQKRFMTLAYERTKEMGSFALVPDEYKDKIGVRPAFGRNGKGRLAGFAFGESFFVKTCKNAKEVNFKVFIDNSNQLAFQKIEENSATISHGTKIYIDNTFKPSLLTSDAKKEIGMRFLVDPHFKVYLNGEIITFEDIPEENIETLVIDVKEVGTLNVKVIDVQATDKSTQLHGIAWHVKNRLVGECTWKGSGSEHLIDGRKAVAKRYIFIVNADCLETAVLPDWTGFNPFDKGYRDATAEVHEQIKSHILDLTKEQRETTFVTIENANKTTLKKMGIVGREKWEKFIKGLQEECPTIGVDDLEKIGALLAKLETSENKYSLIHALANSTVTELNNLNEILTKWDIDFAKIVLDEIEWRTDLLEKLQKKVLSKKTDEVQELQPLFHRGLWIFGPEYETISYTSNKGMTTVIQQLFGTNVTGSTNRPDFAVLPDSSVGLYSLPKYDDTFSEIGVDRLVIVELKKPGIPIDREQKGQAWKYVKELFSKGLLKEYSTVICFICGNEIDALEAGRTIEMEGKVIILPIEYDMIIRRAKSRLLNLHEKIKQAPFLKDTRMRAYLADKAQSSLFAEI